MYNRFCMKKTKRSILKKSLHPFLSYAVMLGVGAIAVSSTGSIVGANTENTIVAPVVAMRAAPAKPAAPTDIAELKASATEFAAQLSIIKSQIAELEKYGHTPSPTLMDAIGQGDQLVSSIISAQTFGDIGESDPAAKLQSIGAAIAANSKF